MATFKGSTPPSIPEDFRAARAAAREFTDIVLRLPNVIGCGVARRTVGGRETDEWCFVTYVSRKLPPDMLHASELVPRELHTLEGTVLTDVEERPEPRFLADTSLYRPLQGGCQILSAAGGGTLGAVVYDGTDFQPVLLTCNHCLTLLGQRTTIPANSQVRQPARVLAPTADINNPFVFRSGPIVGSTKRIVPWLMPPLGATHNFQARVDAGIVALNPDVDAAFRVIDVGKHPYVILPPYEGLRVVKRGWVTERTEGVVKAIDVSITIRDDDGKLIRIGGVDSGFGIKSQGSAFARRGDSGSLIVDADGGAARGMLFGGDTPGPFSWTYACELNAVFEELQLETPCTGGLHAAIKRAVLRRYTDAWTEVEARGGGLVGEMVRKTDRFRDRYLPADDNGKVSGAFGSLMQNLASELAEQVHGDEDFAGLLDRAFGDWFALPTMYDMLEYQIPEDLPQRIDAAFRRLRELSPDAKGYEWLTTAIAGAIGLTMREFFAREFRNRKTETKQKGRVRTVS
jgi:hypothetical protein